MKKYYYILLSVVHAFFFLYITFILFNQPPYFIDTGRLALFKLIDFTSIEDPLFDDLVFINTSYSQELTPIFDGGFDIGNGVRTDRRQLKNLFSKLEGAEYKAVICDIDLSDSLDIDSSLYTPISKLDNFFLAVESDSDNNIKRSKYAQTGFINFESIGDEYVKFRLAYNDSVKSLPLEVYLALQEKNYQHGLVSKIGDNYLLNNRSPQFIFRNYHVTKGEDDINETTQVRYSPLNLQDLMELPSTAISSIVKDKIVLIGDFYLNDQHDSLIGKISGPLILLNAYYSLLNNDYSVTIGLIISLFIGYLLLSFWYFYPRNSHKSYPGNFHKLIEPEKLSKIRLFFWKSLNTTLLVTFLSVFIYFVFGIALDVFFILAYWIVLDYLILILVKKGMYFSFSENTSKST